MLARAWMLEVLGNKAYKLNTFAHERSLVLDRQHPPARLLYVDFRAPKKSRVELQFVFDATPVRNYNGSFSLRYWNDQRIHPPSRMRLRGFGHRHQPEEITGQPSLLRIAMTVT
ncbi:hypothetical protein DPSP01_010410 [Paraphaeosphaeria sporulosa]